MKKCVTVLVLLALVMALASGCAASGDDTSDGVSGSTVPPDVAGTPYEEAVVNLLDKGILGCYEDGTFGLENTMTRAEICVILAKVLGASEAELNEAPDSGMTGLENHSWAVSAINYGVARGYIYANPGSDFHPDQEMSFAEFVSLMVNALGYDADDMSGSWPEYMFAKASEVGILGSIPESVINAKETEDSYAGSAKVQRGEVALMLNNAVDILSADTGQ